MDLLEKLVYLIFGAGLSALAYFAKRWTERRSSTESIEQAQRVAELMKKTGELELPPELRFKLNQSLINQLDTFAELQPSNNKLEDEVARPRFNVNEWQFMGFRKSELAEIEVSFGSLLEDSNLTFGILHVRDGKDEIPDHGPLLNQEHRFELNPTTESSTVSFHFDGRLGFQFKCFVDYNNYTFDVVKAKLEKQEFPSVSLGLGKRNRAWFLLPTYDVCTTIDGFENNFFYPA